MDNQHANLLCKTSVNSTPDLTIFSDASKKGWSASCQGITTGGSMIFSGESLAHKCSRVRSSEASNSFFYKIQETKINSSTDRQHDSSFLFIKHGRNPEQTCNRNLERNLGLSHREENTFDGIIYTQSEQSNSRLGIPKLPGQQGIETLPNCFSSIVNEVIRGNFRFLYFFLRENLTRIKSIKSTNC